MAQYNQDDLIELGKKVIAQREKEKVRNLARTDAVKQLIVIHRPEFEKLLKAAKVNRGI